MIKMRRERCFYSNSKANAGLMFRQPYSLRSGIEGRRARAQYNWRSRDCARSKGDKALGGIK